MAQASYTTVVPGVGSFTMTGGDALMARLRGLEPKVRRTVARRAVRAGAVIWRDAARAGAVRFDRPKTRSKVYANITVREAGRLGRANGGVAVRVGVLGGARRRPDSEQMVGPPLPRRLREKRRNDTYYWRFLEFGTRRTRARPFLRPAYNANLETATDAVARVLAEGIDRVVAGP